MAAQFKQDVLKVVVGQVCQVVGFQGIYSVPLEVLVDLLHRYILKIAGDTKKYAEHCGRTEPCLADLNLSLKDLGVSLTDLEEYVNNVEPFPFPHQIPEIPIKRPSNLNFLKPGSKETLSRPIHIHEHLPPMYPEKEDDDDANLSTNDSFEDDQLGTSPITSYNDMITGDGDENHARRGRHTHEDDGQPVREIDSVMMTSSGFISSSREGKLPESRRPNIALPSVQKDSSSSLKKKAHLEKIHRHKTQLASQPSPLVKPPRPKEIRFKPKIPSAPPGTCPIKPGKVAPVLKMPTPKKIEESVEKETEKKKPHREEHRHKDRRRDRDRNRDNDAKYRGRMRMRGLSKEEELRRYKQREQELIAALKASASVTVTSIPPPSLRVREKTPDKDSTVINSPGKSSPDSKKLSVFKKIKVKDFSESLKSPSNNLIDIQNIKEEKLDEDDFSSTPNPYMNFDPIPIPPETPGKMFFEGKVDLHKKAKQRNSSTKSSSKRHSKGSKRRKGNFLETQEYSNRVMKASPEMKSPPREFLPFPNAPSHIPSFSEFSTHHHNLVVGPPQADIKPFANIFPNPVFSAPLPMNESQESNMSTHTGMDEFEHSLQAERSFQDEPEETIVKIPTSTPKVEKKKEHKRDKKIKDKDAEKEKAKKKKKDKERAKEEKKKEKERLKEERRKKKKEKEEAIPKITLKLQPEQSPHSQPVEPKPPPKLVIKPVKRPEEIIDNHPTFTSFTSQCDEPGSPEIAKFSALITRPSKSSSKKHSDTPTIPPLKIKDPSKKEKRDKKRKHSFEKPHTPRVFVPPQLPFSPTLSTETSTPKRKKHSSPNTALLTETVGPVGCFKDDQGNEVWICPTCVKQDDGSPMIGCDTCDDWYHWVCVGIQVAPNENVNWYCPRCISLQKQRGGIEKKKRGRKKKLI